MAGHSKWANIKHKKAKEDSKRASVFTKIIKEITLAAKAGGGEVAHNPRLRQLVSKAKDVNMPQENITRAIKKGIGELPGQIYEEIVYEAYGPGGIAIIFRVLTDNKNRTIAELRSILNKYDGRIVENGSVAWMFEYCGVIRAVNINKTEEELLELLIDFDIKELELESGVLTIQTVVDDLSTVKDELLKLNFKVEVAELEWVSKNKISIDSELEKKALAFLEKLEEHDDVQNIFTNL